jgi:uncharacterized protein (UPF0212 family)
MVIKESEMRSHSCPKCQSAMEEGFTLSERESRRRAAGWVAGAPKRNLLMGLELPHKPIDIQSWRCPRCGLIENYAKN